MNVLNTAANTVLQIEDFYHMFPVSIVFHNQKSQSVSSIDHGAQAVRKHRIITSAVNVCLDTWTGTVI